jgi:acetyl esterase
MTQQLALSVFRVTATSIALGICVLVSSCSPQSSTAKQPQPVSSPTATNQLDPQVQTLLQQMATNQPPSGNQPLTPEAAIAAEREGYRQVIPLAGKPEEVYNIADRQISNSIPIRIYTPSAQKNLPILVYFHGGGFSSGGLDTHDTPLRALANRSGCIVVSVAYRLAPEHPFPAGIEDAYTATKWVSENAKSLGGDPARVAVGGDSAGGTIATVVTQMARDRQSPPIAYQVLIYPNTDATMSSASWRELGNKEYVLTTQGTTENYARYIPEGVDREQPYISPLKSSDLSNLPPAFILTAEFDPLRDEGEAYAERLRQADVTVKVTRYPGMIHGFFQMGGVIDRGNAAIEDVAEALRTSLATN